MLLGTVSHHRKLAVKKAFKTLSQLLHRPAAACALISLIVFAAVAGLRSLGLMQTPEMIAHDFLVRYRTKPDSMDNRMVLVGMTEKDLQDLGYPLNDGLLASLLTKIDSQKPAAIGMDLYRDLKEPRSGESYGQLEKVLRETKSIVTIERIGYVKGPPALRDDPDRVAANNLPKDGDIDGLFRRGLLIYEDGVEAPIPSLSLAVTLKYLEANGVGFEFVKDGQGKDVLKLGNTVIPRLTPNAGGYHGLEIHNYEYLVDFEAPRRFLKVGGDARKNLDQSGENTSHDYTFGDVLNDRVPPGAFTGKIVYVATVMQSIKDSNPTPINDNFRGVQQHMMMTHQLLEFGFGRLKPMAWWPEWTPVLSIAVAAFLGGMLGLWLHSPLRFAPALAVLLAAFAAFGWVLFFHSRGWLPVVAPILAGAISAALVLSVVAYFESAERSMIKSMFSKHTSAAVVDELLKERAQFLDGGRMKARRVVATILFTDLKGFSTTSEKMDPETLMDWMNEYFDGIASHVERNGGIIDKFIGDAIMGVFGVPVVRTNEAQMDEDAVNAVECALAMRATLVKLNEGWREAGRPTTAMRVGIHTGPVVSGHLGTSGKVDYTVLGDAVNTAARLEGAGKDFGEDAGGAECTILISDATCSRLKGRYVTRLLGPLSLKGKADQVIVHSVISAKEHSAL